MAGVLHLGMETGKAQQRDKSNNNKKTLLWRTESGEQTKQGTILWKSHFFSLRHLCICNCFHRRGSVINLLIDAGHSMVCQTLSTYGSHVIIRVLGGFLFETESWRECVFLWDPVTSSLHKVTSHQWADLNCGAHSRNTTFVRGAAPCRPGRVCSRPMPCSSVWMAQGISSHHLFQFSLTWVCILFYIREGWDQGEGGD